MKPVIVLNKQWAEKKELLNPRPFKLLVLKIGGEEANNKEQLQEVQTPSAGVVFSSDADGFSCKARMKVAVDDLFGGAMTKRIQREAEDIASSKVFGSRSSGPSRWKQPIANANK